MIRRSIAGFARRTTCGSAAALLILAMVPASLHAADGEGNFALRGFGANSCESAIERLRDDTAAQTAAVAWVLGYTTAFNRVQPDTFDVSPLVDGTAMLRMVIGTCQRVPDSMVETVTHEVLRTLATARVTASTPLVETRAGETVAAVRRETLQRMQEQLVALGHLSGAPDGVYGPQTEAALRSFQQEQDLPETGVADSATIVRLLVELPARAGQ